MKSQAASCGTASTHHPLRPLLLCWSTIEDIPWEPSLLKWKTAADNVSSRLWWRADSVSVLLNKTVSKSCRIVKLIVPKNAKVTCTWRDVPMTMSRSHLGKSSFTKLNKYVIRIIYNFILLLDCIEIWKVLKIKSHKMRDNFGNREFQMLEVIEDKYCQSLVVYRNWLPIVFDSFSVTTTKTVEIAQVSKLLDWKINLRAAVCCLRKFHYYGHK